MAKIFPYSGEARSTTVSILLRVMLQRTVTHLALEHQPRQVWPYCPKFVSTNARGVFNLESDLKAQWGVRLKVFPENKHDKEQPQRRPMVVLIKMVATTANRKLDQKHENNEGIRIIKVAEEKERGGGENNNKHKEK